MCHPVRKAARSRNISTSHPPSECGRRSPEKATAAVVLVALILEASDAVPLLPVILAPAPVGEGKAEEKGGEVAGTGSVEATASGPVLKLKVEP